MQVRILLIEDDAQLAQALTQAVGQRGHEVVTASTGRSGLTRLSDEIDVVVTDLGLPDIGGLQVIRQLRRVSQIPIVALSGRHEVEVVVACLDAGADDFVHKPFRLADLEARLRAAVRRGEVTDSPATVRSGDLEVDLERRVVVRASSQVHLTPTEWRILAALLGAGGRVVSHRVLAESVWTGRALAQARESLRVHIASLRNKIGGEHILTESGIGYRWTDEDQHASHSDSGPDLSTERDAPTADAESDRHLRHELNNVVATLSVIAGMLDPAIELSEGARSEASRRLSETVDRLRNTSALVSQRLGGR